MSVEGRYAGYLRAEGHNHAARPASRGDLRKGFLGFEVAVGVRTVVFGGKTAQARVRGWVGERISRWTAVGEVPQVEKGVG